MYFAARTHVDMYKFTGFTGLDILAVLIIPIVSISIW